MTRLIRALCWQFQHSERQNCAVPMENIGSSAKKKWFNQNEPHAEQKLALTNTKQYWRTVIKVW